MSESHLPIVAIRGSSGLHFKNGKLQGEELEGYPREPSPNIRYMVFNSDGSLFAWCDRRSVQVVNLLATPRPQPLLQLDRPKTHHVCFSPRSSCLATWEPYVVLPDQKQGSPNLGVWDLKSGACLKSFYQKNVTNWQPQWTVDEEYCVRLQNGDLHVFAKNNFEQVSCKLQGQKIHTFQLSPVPSSYVVACFIAGSKGQPSFVRLYDLPFKASAPIPKAQKSFFKAADRVDMFWNCSGTGLVIETTAEVDKTGSSYYGESGLFFLDTRGDSFKVVLDKDGPIYSVTWSPSGKEFCVIYGYIPSKAKIFNQRCEPLLDMGTGNRNSAYFSPLGNMLLLGGFGNLKGLIELWDVKEQKKIASWQAPDTTFLQWSPDNRHILTATTAPRLRSDNGYRLWHYTGSLLAEEVLPAKSELWEILWQPLSPASFPVEKVLQRTPIPGIKSLQPQASTQAYRPPSARGQPGFKIREEEEQKQMETQPMSKQALKNMKQRQARKAKKENERETNSQPAAAEISSTPNPAMTFESTGDAEKDRKIRNLLKKLKQITQLKEEQNSGKKLEPTQIDKINREEEVRKEIEQLQL